VVEDGEEPVGRLGGGGHFRSECKDICTCRQDFS
jgi:hypothetical protein